MPLTNSNQTPVILLQIVEKEDLLPIIECSPPSFDLEEEVAPLVVEERLPSTPEDPSPTLIVAEVLRNLELK